MTIDQEQYHKPPLSGVTQRVQASYLFNPDSEVGESCSCSSSCSCSICWASATKGGHDPPAMISFRRYDARISRILEHELSTSVFGINRSNGNARRRRAFSVPLPHKTPMARKRPINKEPF